jgi:hypothetical protein
VIDLPLARLGSDVDERIITSQNLASERVELVEQASDAYDCLKQAEQADDTAYAHAVRTPGSVDPGRERTEAAQEVFEGLKRRIEALDHAQDDLALEVAKSVESRSLELVTLWGDRREELRAEVAECLATLTTILCLDGQLQSLTKWVHRQTENAIDTEHPLQHYSEKAVHIDTRTLRHTSGDWIPATRALDSISNAFSQPVAERTDLTLIARQAGCTCKSVTIRTEGPCVVQGVTQPLIDSGLVEVRFQRLHSEVRVLVAASTLESRGAPSVIKSLAPQAMQTFTRGSGQPALDDEATHAILSRTITKPEVDKDEIARGIAMVREPKSPQERLELERGERAAHDAETTTV